MVISSKIINIQSKVNDNSIDDVVSWINYFDSKTEINSIINNQIVTNFFLNKIIIPPAPQILPTLRNIKFIVISTFACYYYLVKNIFIMIFYLYYSKFRKVSLAEVKDLEELK
jgi:hypothetical protein